MEFALRPHGKTLETYRGDGELMGFYAAWPLCTKCDDGGNLDEQGRTYTHGTSAINFKGVGPVIPSFTVHECSMCNTWHIHLTGLFNEVSLSMRVHATHEELDEVEKILGRPKPLNEYQRAADELATKVGMPKYRPKQKENKNV